MHDYLALRNTPCDFKFFRNYALFEMVLKVNGCLRHQHLKHELVVSRLGFEVILRYW